AAFYGVASFLAAKPVADLDLQGKSLPAGWEAAIPNHGKYVQGYLLSSHPAAFFLVLIVLLGSALLLRSVHKVQVAQRIADGASRAKAHSIANGSVFAFLAIVGYLYLTQVLVNVSSA